eukprot:gene6999-19182_t
MNLLSTLMVFLIVVFFQGFAVTKNLVQQASKQPAPQIMHKRFPTNVFVRLLGTWEEPEYAGH